MKNDEKKIVCKNSYTHSLCSAALSLCRRFLNQFETYNKQNIKWWYCLLSKNGTKSMCALMSLCIENIARKNKGPLKLLFVIQGVPIGFLIIWNN